MKRGYCGIGLHNPKHEINIGGASRAANCYGATFVAVSGNRVKIRSSMDTQKYYRHHPVFRIPNLRDAIPFDCIPIAVDILESAIPLWEYEHPTRAFYIFGAEDETLPHTITDWCRDKIYIPTEFCMNLAATVNVILYDRLSKNGRNNHET